MIKKSQSDESAESSDFDDEVVEIDLTEIIKEELNRDRPEIKVKTEWLARKMRNRRAITAVQSRDPIFLLSKLKKMEDEIEQFKYLEKQSKMGLIPSSLHYTLRSTPVNNSQAIYPLLEKIISESANPKIPAIKIQISKINLSLIKFFLQGNLRLVENRVGNLEQMLNLKGKTKHLIRAVANDFFYDQQLINRLIVDYDKLKDGVLSSVMNTIENHDSGAALGKIGFEYDDKAILGLRPVTDDLITNLLKKIK